MSSGPSLTDLAPVVAFWRDLIERLSELASPRRYPLPAKWAAMRRNSLAFCDRFGAETYRLGWTASQLSGVHPENGTFRVDYCGILIANDRTVVGVAEARIVFDLFSGYRTKPGPVFGGPIREFAARRGRT